VKSRRREKKMARRMNCSLFSSSPPLHIAIEGSKYVDTVFACLPALSPELMQTHLLPVLATPIALSWSMTVPKSQRSNKQKSNKVRIVGHQYVRDSLVANL
jgi:hypothetical protein